MKNIRGFLDYKRDSISLAPELERIKSNDEFFTLLSKEQQEIQAARCMNCGVAFCQASIIIKGHEIGCPNLNLIPEWNDLLAKGLWELAFKRLEFTMPFPEFTGRVCPAPCEVGCVVSANGEPVSIKDNELALAEFGFNNDLMKTKDIKRNGKKVAIIGSGPAGLACGNELNKLGYLVSVFEKDERPGGLLMYGIPDAKLSKEVVKRRIDLLKNQGIEFITNTNIDSSEKLEKLKKDFNKIVLAVGARKERKPNLKNLNIEGIFFAMDFLTSHTISLYNKNFKNKLNVKNKKVVIIGSGDTSTDCVAVSLRQGAKSVIRLERSPKKPLTRLENNIWPEMPETLKTDYGIKEAIAVFKNDPREFCKVIKYLHGDLKLTNITTSKLKVELINGVKHSYEILDSREEVEADVVIFALGFSGCEDYIFKSLGLESQNDLIKQNNFKTLNGLYSCGDCNIGPSLVVNAIKEGIECARVVHNDFKANI